MFIHIYFGWRSVSLSTIKLLKVIVIATLIGMVALFLKSAINLFIKNVFFANFFCVRRHFFRGSCRVIYHRKKWFSEGSIKFME